MDNPPCNIPDRAGVHLIVEDAQGRAVVSAKPVCVVAVKINPKTVHEA